MVYINHKEAPKLGFTLVELIIVIVILGILSVVSLPRFIDLSGEARVAKLQGVKSQLKTGMQLIYSKALIQGLQKSSEPETITINNEVVELYYGYPQARWDVGISRMLDLGMSLTVTHLHNTCNTDWCIVGGREPVHFNTSGAFLSDNDNEHLPYTGLALKIWPKGYSGHQRCGVFYINKEDGSDIVLDVTTLDC